MEENFTLIINSLSYKYLFKVGHLSEAFRFLTISCNINSRFILHIITQFASCAISFDCSISNKKIYTRQFQLKVLIFNFMQKLHEILTSS